VAIGIQPDFLVFNPEANIIRRIRIWFDAQEFMEYRLRSSQVRDGIDDGSDTLIHGELLLNLLPFSYIIKILDNKDIVKR
jgi:hypothetical protein